MIDLDLLQTTNEPLANVFQTWRQHLHLGAEEDVAAVEVEDVVGSGGASLGRVLTVEDEAHGLPRSLNHDHVPLTIVHWFLGDPSHTRTTATVETVLDDPFVNLSQPETHHNQTMYQNTMRGNMIS